MLRRLARYFRPHLYAMTASVAFAWSLGWLVRLGSSSCTALCQPSFTVTMGLLGGFLGAQLYRSEHPLP